MMRPTGLRRRSEDVRRRLGAERPYHAAGDLLGPQTVMQPILRDHAQGDKPSCVGQSLAEGIEPHLGAWVSSVDLWTDARRRQGDLGDPSQGTDSHHAIDSVILRGVSSYVAGEDERPEAEDRQIADLEQELAADARRVAVDAVHRTILVDRAAALVDALQRGYACSFGAGVLDPYMRLGLNAVAGAACWGDDGAGHEQRLIGWIADDDRSWPGQWRGSFLVQNHWREWGGLVLPCPVVRIDGVTLAAGTLLRSCVLVTARVLDQIAWDIDTLEVRFG